jgi:hypothetical protein
MKPRVLALILALTVACWAQTATQNTPATPPQSTAPAEKAKCPCCDKMAASDTKDARACCAHHDHHSGDSKEMASCCSGKDAKSCCGDADAKSCIKSDKDKAACCADCGKDKTAAACCGGNCGKEPQKGCCCATNKTEKTARNCCAREHRS